MLAPLLEVDEGEDLGFSGILFLGLKSTIDIGFFPVGCFET